MNTYKNKVVMKLFAVLSRIRGVNDIIGIYPTYHTALQHDQYAIVQKIDLIVPTAYTERDIESFTNRESFDVHVLFNYNHCEPHDVWGMFADLDDAVHMQNLLKSICDSQTMLRTYTVCMPIIKPYFPSHSNDGVMDRQHIIDYVDKKSQEQRDFDIYKTEYRQKLDDILQPFMQECKKQFTGPESLHGKFDDLCAGIINIEAYRDAESSIRDVNARYLQDILKRLEQTCHENGVSQFEAINSLKRQFPDIRKYSPAVL